MNTKINAKGLVALEGLNAPSELEAAPVQTVLVIEPEVSPDAVVIHDAEKLVENDIIDVSAAVGGVIELKDQVHEAEQIVETLDNMTDAIDAADQGPGLTPQEAQVIRVAVEHFGRQLGYQGPRHFPALENFGGVKSRREGTNDLVSYVRGLAVETRSAIRIAQENLLDKVNEIWTTFWDGQDKLVARLEEVSKAFDKGAKHEDAIDNPSWGASLNAEGKDMVLATDVILLLSKLVKALDNDILADINNRTAEAAEDLSKALVDENDEAVTEAVTKIGKIKEEVEKIATAVREDFPEEASKVEGQFAPISAAEKEKFVDLIAKILDSKALKEATEKLTKASKEFEVVASDKEGKDQGCVDLIIEVESLTVDVMAASVRICHAAVSLMAESFESK